MTIFWEGVAYSRANLFVCYCLIVIMWFLLERFIPPQGAWDGLRYLTVALPEPSIYFFYINI